MGTEIHPTKRRENIRNWATEVELCRNSGLTVQQWCEENRISVKTYYYHLRRVREELLSENRVVAVGNLQFSEKIEIAVDDIRISLPAGSSAETLQTVLRALKDVG